MKFSRVSPVTTAGRALKVPSVSAVLEISFLLCFPFINHGK